MPVSTGTIAINSPRCECPSCGEVFSRVMYFDKHRVNGKCLPTEKFGTKDIVLGERGVWIGFQERFNEDG